MKTNLSENAVVSATGLTKKFADFLAVDHISFQVHANECFGVLGPNGAGKTTTLRMMLGLVLPTEGELSVLGYRLPDQASELRARVGVVPQHDNLDIEFSVIENLRSYASYFGLSGKKIENRISELLDFVELTDKSNAKVNNLSGGMKRRLTLARSLINEPELLILDEPTTGLDPQARQILWQRLRKLKKQGATLILTTHYLEEAQRLCDRLIVVDHGKILTEGSPNELIKRYVEPHVIEIHGEKLAQWRSKLAQMSDVSMEMIGETLFCYCHADVPIVDLLETADGIEYLSRRANLEDVFLKLTGRELRDG